MSDYNLFLEPDEDIETFRDIITDNVFIKGELIGGADIVAQMHASGDLLKAIQEATS